jgi:hypothetical protein
MCDKNISKKVLLINPPFYRLMYSHFNGLSLGLSYIAAVLSKNGHDVKIYNTDYKSSKNYADQRGIFESYDNYKKILSDLNHPLWLEVKKSIKRYSPDIVGISMLTGTYKSAENVGRIAKELNEDVVVVVGGTHPTVLPDETIKNEYFDYVVRGEGEYTFLDLAEGVMIADIPGLTYINERGRVANNPDREFIEDLVLNALFVQVRKSGGGMSGFGHQKMWLKRLSMCMINLAQSFSISLTILSL